MAEVETPAAAAASSSPEVAKVEITVEAVQEEVAGKEENHAAVSDHKRKHEDVVETEEEREEACEKPEEEEAAAAAAAAAATAAAAAAEVQEEAEPAGEADGGVQEAIKKAKEFAARLSEDAAAPGDAKRPRLDGEADGSAADEGQQVQKLEIPEMGNGQLPSTEKSEPTSAENLQENVALVPQYGNIPSGQQPTFESQSSSRKIDVPNNKVGVLIGKAGETIRFLQYNSGAKIQITRDVDADPQSSTRPVELIGTLESINKAEQLIKDVIAEADAGGSPALVARGFGTAQPGSEQLQIQVPNEKVGLIIGKGGETIKNLQTRSGARIQLIPQHLPEGDLSKERTVRITGNKKQIEAATEMIKEVMSQVPGRPSQLSGGYSHQMYRPRGPAVQHQWGPRAMSPSQPTSGYDHQQRGMYPPQATQYPPQTYGGYPQQAPQRGGWEQRSGAPVQTPSQMGGYDYYGQGGHPADLQPSAPAPAAASTPTPAPVNYNYGSSQAPGYGQSPYPQSALHGYDEPKYDNQAPSQQVYGQQPISSQPSVYPQQGGTPHAGYAQQQPYNRPPYGGGPQQGPPQSYGPPRPAQPGDAMYQGPVPSSYGSMPTAQQPYPYGSSAPSQQAPGYAQQYGPTSGSADGYTQPSAGYPQQGGQAAAGYAQVAQPTPASYPQGGQPGGYGQYPTSQPSYGEQPVPSNVSYGYQGGPAAADSGYASNLPTSGYGGPQPASGQVGYAQPPANPSGYEQTMPPQPGYGSIPGSAQVGFVKSVSPQPGYVQYDSTQAYGHH